MTSGGPKRCWPRNSGRSKPSEGRREPLDMIGHQYISVNADPIFSSGFAQTLQVEAVILLGVEAGLAIVAPWMMCWGRR
jgi:hypothetical protein